MKPYKRGYVSGVFDMFHIGHLNLLRRAKEQCEYLLVGVVEEELSVTLKGVKPRIPQEERLAIIRAIEYVDEAFLLPLPLASRMESWKVYRYDVAFSGNDREGNPVWEEERKFLQSVGSDLVYFPYTQGRTSTQLRESAEAGAPALPVLNQKISFLIPTYNAGAGFADVLRLVGMQEGFSETELIVVDSGSEDETVALAAAAGAQLIQIPNEEFTHAHARNLGVAKATGEYVLLMTQDAYPTCNQWARLLVQPVLEGKAAAASPVQQPHEDAPLFEKILSYELRRYTRPDGVDRFTSLPLDGKAESIGPRASIDNVSCAIRRETLFYYPFEKDYGEDNDLGRRLLRDGYRLALLCSVQVTHSHDRPLRYRFERVIQDVLHLAAAPVQPVDEIRLCGRLLLGYEQANFLASSVWGWQENTLEAAEMAKRLRDLLASPEIAEATLPVPPKPRPCGDEALDELLLALRRAFDAESAQPESMAPDFTWFTESDIFPYFEYAGKTQVNRKEIAQLAECFLIVYFRQAAAQLATQALACSDGLVFELVNEFKGKV